MDRGYHKEVQPWVDRQHGEMDFYLTQFLCRNSFFKLFLCQMGKTIHRTAHRGLGTKDSMEHTLIRCSYWEISRNIVISHLGYSQLNRSLQKSWRVRTHGTVYHIVSGVFSTPRRKIWTETQSKVPREFIRNYEPKWHKAVGLAWRNVQARNRYKKNHFYNWITYLMLL